MHASNTKSRTKPAEKEEGGGGSDVDGGSNGKLRKTAGGIAIPSTSVHSTEPDSDAYGA